MSAKSKASVISNETVRKGGGRIIAENEALVRMLREQTDEIHENKERKSKHDKKGNQEARSNKSRADIFVDAFIHHLEPKWWNTCQKHRTWVTIRELWTIIEMSKCVVFTG